MRHVANRSTCTNLVANVTYVAVAVLHRAGLVWLVRQDRLWTCGLRPCSSGGSGTACQCLNVSPAAPRPVCLQLKRAKLYTSLHASACAVCGLGAGSVCPTVTRWSTAPLLCQQRGLARPVTVRANGGIHFQLIFHTRRFYAAPILCFRWYLEPTGR